MSSFLREAQASVRNNASAYGYSVMITASFGGLVQVLGSPSIGQIFLYALGPVLAFTVVDVFATAGFKVRPRGESPEVVVLGSAIGYFSVGAGVGAAVLVAELIDAWPAWIVAPGLATLAYLTVLTLEMLLARNLGSGSKSQS